VFSVVAVVAGETSIEVATVGREGMVGLPLFLGATSSPNSAFCQIAGRSLRLSARAFGEVLAADGALHRQIHRFVQATMVQLAQNVACNRLHTAEQRASRWLLMTQDRVGENEFLLTQEFLAQMIGVRRATVSAVASALQRDGLIRYSRGQITVIDRGRLEASACECYGVVRAEFDALRRRK
jgi:CRP-like cAMP-binding protein